jgi:hypothetical protein
MRSEQSLAFRRHFYHAREASSSTIQKTLLQNIDGMGGLRSVPALWQGRMRFSREVNLNE